MPCSAQASPLTNRARVWQCRYHLSKGPLRTPDAVFIDNAARFFTVCNPGQIRHAPDICERPAPQQPQQPRIQPCPPDQLLPAPSPAMLFPLSARSRGRGQGLRRARAGIGQPASRRRAPPQRAARATAAPGVPNASARARVPAVSGRHRTGLRARCLPRPCQPVTARPTKLTRRRPPAPRPPRIPFTQTVHSPLRATAPHLLRLASRTDAPRSSALPAAACWRTARAPPRS